VTRLFTLMAKTRLWLGACRVPAEATDEELEVWAAQVADSMITKAGSGPATDHTIRVLIDQFGRGRQRWREAESRVTLRLEPRPVDPRKAPPSTRCRPRRRTRDPARLVHHSGRLCVGPQSLVPAYW